MSDVISMRTTVDGSTYTHREVYCHEDRSKVSRSERQPITGEEVLDVGHGPHHGTPGTQEQDGTERPSERKVLVTQQQTRLAHSGAKMGMSRRRDPRASRELSLSSRSPAGRCKIECICRAARCIGHRDGFRRSLAWSSRALARMITCASEAGIG